ncbi:hypothetical protein [Bacteroides sp.]|uniref:hypothetical protein n=1 Tax=Bacteroides sp. TaxID=29523 RepID=UPI002612551C|nr:hypothetical protein [Bacteroides sp.]MDD3036385.1 hypothetical protein [Bacteroides sp.]
MAVSCDPSADGGDSSGIFFTLSILATPNDALKVDKDNNPTPFYYQGKGWAQYFNVSQSYMTPMKIEINEKMSYQTSTGWIMAMEK